MDIKKAIAGTLVGAVSLLSGAPLSSVIDDFNMVHAKDFNGNEVVIPIDDVIAHEVTSSTTITIAYRIPKSPRILTSVYKRELSNKTIIGEDTQKRTSMNRVFQTTDGFIVEAMPAGFYHFDGQEWWEVGYAQIGEKWREPFISSTSTEVIEAPVIGFRTYRDMERVVERQTIDSWLISTAYAASTTSYPMTNGSDVRAETAVSSATFSAKRAEAGSGVDSTIIDAGWGCDGSGGFQLFLRGFINFNLGTGGAASTTISAADLKLTGTLKLDNHSQSPALNVFGATSTRPNIVGGDMHKGYGDALSSAISYASFNDASSADANVFSFNATGVAWVQTAANDTGTVQLALRISNYDWNGSGSPATPTCGSGGYGLLRMAPTESGASVSPKLVITYSTTVAGSPDSVPAFIWFD